MRVLSWKGLVAGLACVPLVFPQAAFADWSALARSPAASIKTVRPETTITDVALLDRGVLQGHLIRLDRTPVANVPVTIKLRGRTVATTATDAKGAFVLSGLRGGVYQVAAPGASQVYRLWAPRTAPPAARRSVELVSGRQLVRGQSPGARSGILVKSLVIGGVVATAVAVPLAVHNHNSHTDRDTE